MMVLATAAAAVAGTTAAAAYLDAKIRIRKDLGALAKLKGTEKTYQRHAKQHRESCYYLFDSAASEYPDALVVWSRTGCYTWREAHNRVSQYASFFLSLGVQPGSLVAFYMQNSPELIFSWLGLWAIGCAPAMINCSLGADALVHCLRISTGQVIIVDEDFACQERIQHEKYRIEGELGVRIVTLSEDLRAEISNMNVSRPEDTYRDCVNGDSPAILFYTSGTTGLPKAYPFITMRLHMTAILARKRFNVQTGPNGDRWYICMPMYHGTGGVNAVSCLMSGVSLAIGLKFSISRFWLDVCDSESTFFVYVGEIARYLLAAPPSSLDKAHRIRCIHGNGMRPDVWAKFQERFNIPEVAEFFSSTEGMFALINWTRNPYSINAVGHHGLLLRQLFRRRLVPVAVDVETGDIYRSPNTGLARRTSYSEGGEILVRIPNESAFTSYWQAPSATEKKFARDVFRKGDLYYRTGDTLRRTDDGYWFFLDRLGDTFRWKSENVSTAEVAEVLGRYPGIPEANVYGVLVPGHDGRAGCAAITLAPAERDKFDWKAFATYAREKLPGYAVPIFVRVLDGEIGVLGSHNHKQNKVPLRDEGIEPKLLGTRIQGGERDKLYWIPPKGNEYMVFGEEEWKRLVAGNARL